MTLMQLAKGQGVTIFVIGHVNKEGSIAGPKVLEHMVDCVLYFEGEQHNSYRSSGQPKTALEPPRDRRIRDGRQWAGRGAQSL